MRAAVYVGQGVRVDEVERPVPGDGEVLIDVRAASINAPDWRLMGASPRVRKLMFAMRKSKIARPGSDVAGVVAAVGGGVTRFKPGDAVFGAAPGAFAEFACTKEPALVAKPDAISFEQGACIAVSGLTALQGLRDVGKLQPGQHVLINGASGAVGPFAVQIAKAMGAHVTAVCNTRNVEMVASIGADRVIDYAKEDFLAVAQRYDVIFDVVGNRPLLACRRLLTPNGVFVGVGGPKSAWKIGARIVRMLFLPRFKMFMARLRQDDLAALAELVATGKVTPVIERSYPLSDIAGALQYAAEGHSRAKLVITM